MDQDGKDIGAMLVEESINLWGDQTAEDQTLAVMLGPGKVRTTLAVH